MRTEVWFTLRLDEFEALQAQLRELQADLDGWARIWNDPVMLAGRLEALRDGTAQC